MRYRLALDLGTNSIGWAVFRLYKQPNKKRDQPAELIRIGSRIFPEGRDPKTQESLGAKRRLPRSQRRHRDRYLQRRTNLINCLQRNSLFPPLGSTAARTLQTQDPYKLRADGLDNPLSPYQFGRALFHLNQRRGFKSNRKADSKDNESGKIKQGIQTLQADMDEYHIRTAGEALHERLQNGQSTRARLQGKGAKTTYAFYIGREMVEAEFEALWKAQRPYHPSLLTEELHAELHHIIFHQRPLKAPPVGRCTLEPDQLRAPKALLSSQRFRLYQELNHLRLLHLETGEETSLSRTQRDTLAAFLEQRSVGKYSDLRKQLFGKAGQTAYSFTVENSSIARKSLPGNTTNYKLAHKNAFGKHWYQLDPETQDTIVNRLLALESTTDTEEFIIWLTTKHQIDIQAAEYIANKVHLEPGHLRFSEQAVNKVLPSLQTGWDNEQNHPLTYDQAVRAAGYADHRIQAPDQLLTKLPYYGEILWRHCQEIPTATHPGEQEYGRITNPTVHIGLNQLRQLVNTLIRRYGHPAEVHIELARELKLSRERKAEINAKNAKNRAFNEKLNQEIEAIGEKPNRTNRLKLKLFKELDTLNPTCVYSGQRIHPSQLYTNAYQIDHILPFSKTLDDGYNNKVLVTREANATKGNQSVYEMCQYSSYNWEDIQDRITQLPKDKQKRFTLDALEKWLSNTGNFEQGGASFLQRQLTDTAYFARVTREYLQHICPANKIVSSPGRLTALLRAKWGLNDILSKDHHKNRNDHRHHAIDAVVIGLTDRSMLQKVATLAGQLKNQNNQNAENLFRGVNEKLPFPNLVQQTRNAAERCIVSHKPDHNPHAQLHQETAYGIVEILDPDKNLYQTRHRIALAGLKRKDFAALENTRLTAKLESLTEGFSETELKNKLIELAQRKEWPQKVYLLRKISGVPVALKGTALSPNPAKRPPNPAKLYKTGGNYCYEIYRTAEGKWAGDIISTFEANQRDYQAFMQNKKRFQTETFRGKPLVMRLINNDMVAIQDAEKRKIMRVQKMTEGQICFSDHFEANVAARDSNKADQFTYLRKSIDALRKIQARKVTVTILGQLKDPGFTQDNRIICQSAS
jgi:CRISPR-associated endonuclease Csn1